VLGPTETHGLKAAAALNSAMLNDLMLREAFLTLVDWMRRAAGAKAGRSPTLIRLAVPNSLRSGRDARLPACNVLGFAFIDAYLSQAHDERALLAAIARDTAGIRRWNGGQMFLDGLALIQRYPRIYRHMLSSDSCFATAVFSYIGDVSATFADIPGDFELLRFFGRPPTRRNTRLAFFVSIVSGRLNLSLGADPSHFSSAERDGLLESFVAGLQRRLGGVAFSS
jgi:hypothetical protein